MKPAWDQLAEAWKDSPTVLIGDVDCTAEGGQQLCSDNGVSGYPTIKYFTDESGRSGYDYSGGRDFDSLNSFVEDELFKECDVKTKEACSEKELKYLGKMHEQGKEKWDTEARRLEGLLSKPSSPDQKAWLSTRHKLLQQLLGRRTVKKGGGRRLWRKIGLALVAFVGAISVIALACMACGGTTPTDGEVDKAEKEETKQEDEPKAEEDKKED